MSMLKFLVRKQEILIVVSLPVLPMELFIL